MKKKLVLALAISYIFSNIVMAEEIQQDCTDQLLSCVEKCTESNAYICEEVCYEKQDLCFEEEDKKFQIPEEK